MRCATRIVAALAAVAVVGYASAASAATFTIDSNLSSLTLGANLGGTQVLFPQFAGSLTSSLTGTFDATLVPGVSVQFNGGGTIDPNLQANPVAPQVNGVAGTAPGDYGGNVNVFGGLVSGPAAGRDFLAEATSGSIAVAGIAFDATQVTLGLTQGFLDYNIGGLLTAVGRADISGNSAANQGAAGTATQVGLLQTITIPVQLDIPIDLDGTVITGTLTGTIVGTFVVPEPGTIAMLGMGVIGLVAVGRRRIRKA